MSIHFAKRLFVLLWVLSPGAAFGQEFSIYTVVKVVGDAGSEPETVSRGNSLFHHGRAYNCLPGIDEITIYEPEHQRFTLLNAKYMMTTTVQFDEIERILEIAHAEVDARRRELSGRNDGPAKQAVALLDFQRKPKFEEVWHAGRGTLFLKSRFVNYDVQALPPRDNAVIPAWTKYADWTARLNYVLSPGPLLPDVRVALNHALASKGVMPTEVVLRADAKPRLHLKAEHKINWKLHTESLRQINHWENLLRHKQMEQVSLQHYQRRILTAAGDR